MIPLRDTVPSRSFPLMTLALIMVNTVVFFYELRLGPALERFLLIYGFVPVRFSEAEPWNLPARFVPLFSSMFLHGSWLHLIGNMWTLWIFGDNVEDRLGRGEYLLLYLASGLAAAPLHIYTNIGPPGPARRARGGPPRRGGGPFPAVPPPP